MRHEPGFGSHPRKDRPAYGAGDAQTLLDSLYAKRIGSNGTEQATGENVGFFAVGVARQEEEFFATPADHRIGEPGRRADAARDLDQHLISNLMPELVVDFLEVVNIDEIEN